MTTITFNKIVEVMPQLTDSQRATLELMLDKNAYNELKKRLAGADRAVKQKQTISYANMKKEFNV